MWYVVEMQTNNGTGSILYTAFANRDAAEPVYHEKLMYAAQSQVEKHGVMLLNDDMFTVKSELYVHAQDA